MCTFERNGLVLNDRSVLDHYHVDEATGFEDIDIVISEEQATERHGGTALPNFYAPRTVTLTGTIRAGSWDKLDDMEAALLSAFRELDEQPLLIDNPGRPGMPAVQLLCRKQERVQITHQPTALRYWRPFQISLRALTEPRIQSQTLHNGSIVPTVITTLGFEYPRDYDEEFDSTMDSSYTPVTGSVNSLAVTNAGRTDTLPVLWFTGGMTDAILINETNGQSIGFKNEISPDETIVIDVSAGTVTTPGGANRFDYLLETSDWLTLEPGVNNLKLSVSAFSDSPSVAVYYRDAW